MIKKYFALSLVTASMVVAGCSSDDDDPVEPAHPAATPGVGGSVYDSIVNSANHTQLRAAIDAAGLADMLDDESSDYTVFAPDDAAFNALNTEDSPNTVADLLADTDELTRVLQYHVLSGTFDSTALSTGAAAATEEAPYMLATLLADASVDVSVSATAATGLAVNNIDITVADVVPAVEDGGDTVEDGGEDGVEDAVEDAVEDVVEDDEDTTTGVVHVLAGVLTPPAATEPDPDTDPDTDPDNGNGTPSEGAGTGQAALESAGTYTNFLGAFGAESYDTNAWTVFAPTDAASAGVTINAQDHIAVNAGALSPAELLAAGTITTNAGKEYAVTGTEDALLVGGFSASLIATGDAGAQIYSLDGVLP